MKMNECYGREEAGELCSMHIRAHDSLFLLFHIRANIELILNSYMK